MQPLQGRGAVLLSCLGYGARLFLPLPFGRYLAVEWIHEKWKKINDAL